MNTNVTTECFWKCSKPLERNTLTQESQTGTLQLLPSGSFITPVGFYKRQCKENPSNGYNEKNIIASVGEDEEQLELSYNAGGTVNWDKDFGNYLLTSTKVEEMPSL